MNDFQSEESAHACLPQGDAAIENQSAAIPVAASTLLGTTPTVPLSASVNRRSETACKTEIHSKALSPNQEGPELESIAQKYNLSAGASSSRKEASTSAVSNETRIALERNGLHRATRMTTASAIERAGAIQASVQLFTWSVVGFGILFVANSILVAIVTGNARMYSLLSLRFVACMNIVIVGRSLTMDTTAWGKRAVADMAKATQS